MEPVAVPAMGRQPGEWRAGCGSMEQAGGCSAGVGHAPRRMVAAAVAGGVAEMMAGVEGVNCIVEVGAAGGMAKRVVAVADAWGHCGAGDGAGMMRADVECMMGVAVAGRVVGAVVGKDMAARDAA